VLNRWAGLRTFVPDRSPLIGDDPAQESFIWCAALGGYGIQTAPAMARLCAALATRQPLPVDLQGIHAEDAAPLRLVGRAKQGFVSVAELD
jgi:D-arginine dehydrogenase